MQRQQAPQRHLSLDPLLAAFLSSRIADVTRAAQELCDASEREGGGEEGALTVRGGGRGGEGMRGDDAGMG